MNPRVLYRAATYATDARSMADSVISALTPAAWYRNATGVTESGGFASQWNDYSGNGGHLVQATGTNQPAYSAGVFTFDGVDNYMKTLAFTLNQPCSYYLVMKQKSYTVGDRFCDGFALASGQILQNAVSPQIQINAGSLVATNSGLALNTRGIVRAAFNGASSALRVNLNVETTGNAGAGNPGGFTIGSRSDGGSPSDLEVEEIVLFPSVLSAANDAAVITALNNALTVF